MRMTSTLVTATYPGVVQVLEPSAWQSRRAAHERRADALLAGHLARRARGEKHPVEDFLFSYYSVRPARLRRWHPGLPHLDVEAFLARRGDAVRFIRSLLHATAARPPFLGCFGMHEWAMVYRQPEHRHEAPLRLGQAGTDAVVEGHRIRCSHVDAFRFFTPEALPRNEIQPTRALQIELEQPGCLHATMDLYKWAAKLGEAVPSELVLDCFELARDVRILDMRASPYDLRGYGYSPVPVETPDGKAAYAAAQREFIARAEPLRARLIQLCDALLGPAREPVSDPARRPRSSGSGDG
jgi:hypothetical protein